MHNKQVNNKVMSKLSNAIKVGDSFMNTTNGLKFYIDEIKTTISWGTKNEYYVIKSKPTDLPEVISIQDWNRYASQGLFQSI
jgi:hypothetical protein